MAPEPAPALAPRPPPVRRTHRLLVAAAAVLLAGIAAFGLIRVLEPEGGVTAIGSGGNYALAAARAIADYETDPETIARKAMAVAADLCVFTNGNVTVETV